MTPSKRSFSPNTLVGDTPVRLSRGTHVITLATLDKSGGYLGDIWNLTYWGKNDFERGHSGLSTFRRPMPPDIRDLVATATLTLPAAEWD
jgi:hypothetical protein